MLVTLLFSLSLHAEAISNLAQSLIDLRASVESLHTQLDDAKDEYSVRMKSLNVQRTDIEASIARGQLKVKQLKAALAKVTKSIKAKSSGNTELKPVALEGLALLKAELKTHLPFKLSARLKQITDLENKIKNNLITPEKGLNRAWALLEDNFRMSHENGLFRQNVTLDGKEYLADVVRIGSVMMFFKTSDEKVGYFTKSTNGWMPLEVLDTTKKEQILYLFDSMKKQIRSGYFVLPYALATQGDK